MRQWTRPPDDAEERSADTPVLHERAEDPLRRAVDRHCQAEADARDGGVDADDPRRRIGERPTGVARVERRVGLDDVLDEAARASVPRGERSPEGGHDAGRHRAGEPERVADRHDELPDTQPCRITERRRLERSLDPQDREVGERVAADHAEWPLGIVDERGGPAVRAGHHVRRRDEESVGRERDRGAGAARRAARPTTSGAAHAHARDRRDESFGDRADRARVRVERLCIVGLDGRAGRAANGVIERGHPDASRLPLREVMLRRWPRRHRRPSRSAPPSRERRGPRTASSRPRSPRRARRRR